jgi:crossover junction endodeoxyribonuclease RusA
VVDVRGIPGAQGSKRHVGNGVMVESSAKVKPWRQDVKAAAETALTASDWPQPCQQPVHLRAIFTFTRPRSHYRTGKFADQLRDDAPLYVTSRGAGDLDKLERSTNDALTAAGVVADDALIVTSRTSKVYGEQSGAHLILITDSEVTA